MIKEFTKGRVAVFIDAANIFYAQRTLGWRIDFGKLSEYLKGEVQLVGLYYYTGSVGIHEKQKRFIQKLERFGYKVASKEIKSIRTRDGSDVAKGNLDVEFSLDAFRSREAFDTLILFSGDSDFAYLLDLLKQDGKRIIVVSMRGHVARELITRSKYIALPKLRGIIEKIKGPDKPAPEV